MNNIDHHSPISNRILANLDICLAYVDNNQCFQYCSRCYEQWFDVIAEQCKNKHLLDIIGPEKYEKNKNYIEEVLQGKKVIFDTIKPSSDKQLRNLRITYQPDIDSSGYCLGFTIFAQDITSEYQAARAMDANHEKMQHQLYHDALTGLPNRLLLLNRFETLLVHAHSHRETLAVALIDLDNFKDINNSLGHQEGDSLLKKVAERISNSIRTQDFIARIGGDEFAVLLPDQEKSAANSFAVITRIMDEIARPYVVEKKNIHLKASIGISMFPDFGRDPSTLLQKADMALNKAKDLGKSRITFFTEDVSRITRRRILLQYNMRIALENNDFELYYQPKVRFRDKKITGVEALIRWRTNQNEIAEPDEFIPLAERTGFIVNLGDWVIKESCRQLKQWLANGMNNLTMSINLSAYQFLDPHLIDKLFSALHRNSLQPGDLHLEITEHTMVKDIAETVAVLHQLAKYGFTVSIDDFGTGFSSLAYLKQLPIHTLKLDRSFVTDIPNNSHDMIIVRLVHSLAESLGFQVIAEGVETREQHEFLENLKCDEFQGFLCSRPLPAQKLENFIKEQVLWKSA